MTLTSFDLVSDFDGAIKQTFDEVDFESAVLNSIHNLRHALLTTENESGLLDCKLVNSDSGEIEKEFVSYSIEAANIETLTLLGYSIFESLTEAEMNSNPHKHEDEEWGEDLEDFEDIEEGKILAFEL